MQIHEAAWLAGLLEGEGYFQVTKPRKHHPSQSLIRLGMTDRDIVEKASSILNVPMGEKIYPNKKNVYSFSLSRKDDVEKVLLQILPFMGKRRSERIGELLYNISQRRRSIVEIGNEDKVRAAKMRWNTH